MAGANLLRMAKVEKSCCVACPFCLEAEKNSAYVQRKIKETRTFRSGRKTETILELGT